jgi:hypothetical protein
MWEGDLAEESIDYDNNIILVMWASFQGDLAIVLLINLIQLFEKGRSKRKPWFPLFEKSLALLQEYKIMFFNFFILIDKWRHQ